MIHGAQQVAVWMVVAAMGASASAQVDKVTLRFDGLACPFCVYNVEKQIKKIEGVGRDKPVENDLKRGLIWFAWDPGRSFDPEALREAAGDSGFTLREMRVSGEGRVPRPSEAHPEQMRLTASGEGPAEPQGKQDLLLVPDARADRREAWDGLRAYAAADAGQPAAVRVEGAVEDVEGGVEDEGSSWRVVLHGWSPVEYGAVVDAEVEGFTCERCSTRTMAALRALDGVIHAQANHETGHVLVWTTRDNPDVARIRESIETLGFTVTHLHGRAHESAHRDRGGHDRDRGDGR